MSKPSQPEKITSEDFLRLQNNPQHYSRMAIAEKIATHIENAEPDTAEYALACDIAFYLQKEDHIPVRAGLSRGIASSEKIPKSLILLLARDSEDDVALPILSKSPLLEDADLLELIRETEEPVRWVAVAEREFLSVTVTATLVEKRHERVTLTLLDNSGAQISDYSYRTIAQNHKRSPIVVEKLMSRIPKPLTDIRTLLAQSSPMQENRPIGNLPSFTPVTPEALKDEILALMKLGENPAHRECQKLAEKMIREKKLNAATLIISLCLGQEEFFHTCLALHTRLPNTLLKTMSMDPAQLRIMFTKARISSSLFPLLEWTLINMQRQKKRGYIPNSGEFVRAMSKSMREAEAQGINFAKTIGIAIIRSLEHITPV